MQKRVPEGEEDLSTQDRQTTVRETPGDDVGYGGTLGGKYGMFGLYYRLGSARHYGDRYKGSLEGNYGRLSQNTDSDVTTQTISTELSTAEAYQRKEFPIPLIIKASYLKPMQGHNAPAKDYVEVSLTSFFSTPMARPPAGHQDVRESSSRKGSKQNLAH